MNVCTPAQFSGKCAAKIRLIGHIRLISRNTSMGYSAKNKKNGANDRIRQGGRSPTKCLNEVKATALQ